MIRRIKKILIANRGEIALRVIKTCREMGIKTVVVYSEHDQRAPYVRSADESYRLEGDTLAETYLNVKRIMQIAKESKADAIHPGYGFLSENPHFVELVTKSGLIFIGPSARAIRKLGNKTEARAFAISLGIPVLPGTALPLKSVQEAIRVAKRINYPILLKAAAGGGGKGMRTVHEESELTSCFKAAQSEAKSSFGDPRIYIEKYLESPKHIEVQILADKFKNVIHLGERECSVQRRHQKIIEESPSIALNDKLRSQLTQAATKLVKMAGYFNAGTVEFLVDKNLNYYFLEVNTRLQVEHPITELRTGIDLVREQILIAEGRRLSMIQEDIRFNGHAIECRICAENPENNFLPSTGTITYLRGPSGFGIREDRGIEEGSLITPFYDSLLSKLIVWGNDRSEALNRLSAALDEYYLYGIRNNLSICQLIINHPRFRGGSYTTKFVEEELDALTPDQVGGKIFEIAGIAAACFEQKSITRQKINSQLPTNSHWKQQRREQMR